VTSVPIPTDSNLLALPDGLPAPVDDGAARHLTGMAVPPIRLSTTRGRTVDVAEVARHRAVLFLYPATVRPGIPIPGEWSEVPGARGCTVEGLGFRDAYARFRALGWEVYGVSGQGEVDPERGLAEQVEFAERVHLPYELLNDSAFELTRALRLPTFVARLEHPTVEFEGTLRTFPLQGRTLVKRLTLLTDRGRIERVFYPVFPPDRHAAQLLAHLERSTGASPLGVRERGERPVPGPVSNRPERSL
jgi:peroxiredoxin